MSDQEARVPNAKPTCSALGRLEDCRRTFAVLREEVNNIAADNPSWSEHLGIYDGGITVLICAMHETVEEMKRAEKRRRLRAARQEG